MGEETYAVEPLTKDVSVQTDLTMDQLDDLSNKMNDLNICTEEKNNLQEGLDNFLFLVDAFAGNDKKTKFFTGLSSSKTLSLLHEHVDPLLYLPGQSLSTFQQLVLTLMKPRLSFSYSYLCYKLIFFKTITM